MPGAADEPVAEYVLLGDDGEIVRLETFLEAEHDMLTMSARSRLRTSAQVLGSGERRHIVVLQDPLKAFARAFGPGGDDDALALPCASASVCARTASIDIAARLGAFGGEAAAALAAKGKDRRGVRRRRLERR